MGDEMCPYYTGYAKKQVYFFKAYNFKNLDQNYIEFGNNQDRFIPNKKSQIFWINIRYNLTHYYQWNRIFSIWFLDVTDYCKVNPRRNKSYHCANVDNC